MLGQPAPDWKVTQPLNGTNPGIAAFRGRPLLLLFFNIGCAGCTGRALPYTLEVAQRFPDVRIIGIHTSFEAGSTYPVARIKAVVDYFRLPYLVILDDGHVTFDAYQAEGTPHWVLVDAQGTIHKSIFGSMLGSLQQLDYSLVELYPEVA